MLIVWEICMAVFLKGVFLIANLSGVFFSPLCCKKHWKLRFVLGDEQPATCRFKKNA